MTIKNPLQLRPEWRDDRHTVEPHAMVRFASVFASECWVSRFYHVPANQDEVLAAQASLEVSIAIPQGAVIYGFYHQYPTLNPLPFRFQMIDQTLQHDIFGGTIPDCYVYGAPWLFPCPYPVVGTGQFTFRFYNPSDVDPVRVPLILGVAEMRRRVRLARRRPSGRFRGRRQVQTRSGFRHGGRWRFRRQFPDMSP